MLGFIIHAILLHSKVDMSISNHHSPHYAGRRKDATLLRFAAWGSEKARRSGASLANRAKGVEKCCHVMPHHEFLN